MLADSLGSEAEAYLNAGEYDASLECCRQALDICVKTNNLWGQSYDQMLMSFALFESGQLGRGIKIAEESIVLGDEAGLIATSITLRSELAWVYAYCGAIEKAHPLIEQATQISNDKQPAWRSYPQAAGVRINLFANEIEAAEQITGMKLLQPISIPYARFTILIALANIQLAAAKMEFQQSLTLANALLEEVVPLTRVDVPEALRWKGKALVGLGRIEEALPCLTEARARAKKTNSNLYLWEILADLADIQSKLGRPKEAGENRNEARKIASGRLPIRCARWTSPIYS